ncbi:MAG: sterol desaturase family protein [Actinomycetota bacterium]
MAMARRLGPALLGVGVLGYWMIQAPIPTAVIFGLTAGFVVVERLTGTAHRAGMLDDLAHLTITTLLVRLTGIELLMAAFQDLRGGWTIAELPLLPRVVIVVVVFDLVGYLHHRLMHESPLLWPVHRVHHAIEQVDVMVKARRHPIDDVLLLVFFGAAGFGLGVDTTSLFVVGAVATLHGMVVHSDIIVRPTVFDRLFVTPWVHHRHHGVLGQTGDFGGLLTVWDRAFGTLGAGAPSPAGAGDDELVGDWVDQMLHPVRDADRRRLRPPVTTGIQGPVVTVGGR